VNEVNERTNERTNERKAVVVCTFVRSFLPSFVRSFVRSFARCGRRFWISDKVAVCRLRSAVCRLPFAVCGLCVVGCSAVAVLWLCGCHAVNCRASFIQSSLRSHTNTWYSPGYASHSPQTAAVFWCVGSALAGVLRVACPGRGGSGTPTSPRAPRQQESVRAAAASMQASRRAGALVVSGLG